MLKLKGNNLPWCVNMHPRDEVWMEDSVLRLKGAGGTKGGGNYDGTEIRGENQ